MLISLQESICGSFELFSKIQWVSNHRGFTTTQELWFIFTRKSWGIIRKFSNQIYLEFPFSELHFDLQMGFFRSKPETNWILLKFSFCWNKCCNSRKYTQLLKMKWSQIPPKCWNNVGRPVVFLFVDGLIYSYRYSRSFICWMLSSPFSKICSSYRNLSSMTWIFFESDNISWGYFPPQVMQSKSSELCARAHDTIPSTIESLQQSKN